MFEEKNEEYFTKNQIIEYCNGLSDYFSKIWLVGETVPRKGDLTSQVVSNSVKPVPYIEYKSNVFISVLMGIVRVIRAALTSSKAIINLPSIAHAPLIIPIAVLTDHLCVYVANDPHDIVNRSPNSLPGHIIYWFKRSLNIYHTYLALKLSDSILVRGDKSRYDKFENVHESQPIISINDSMGSEDTNDKFEFLYVGGLYERKGVDVLLSAFSQIIRDDIDIWLRIVGNGEQREELEELSKHLNIRNRVVFEGYIDDSQKLAKIYNQSEVLVHPATHGEGSPRVIDEAHLYGLPVVATELEYLSESLINGENILFATPGSVSSLADQLQKMYYDTEMREKIAENGRDRIDIWSYKSASEQHVKIMNSE